MARCLRQDWPGAVHHLYGRGNAKQAIFRDSEDYAFFLRRLLELTTELGAQVIAYCLMTTHYHLVVESGPEPLPSIMQRLLTAYARVFNDRWNLVGHPFQGRYQNRVVTSDNDLRNVIRYVHRNPLEAGMVKELGSWRWSSHLAILGAKDPLIDPARLRNLFGGADEYLRFLVEPRPGAERPALEELSASFGGAVLLRGRSRSTADSNLRRSFVAAAIQVGYRRSEVAKYMWRTTAALSMMFRTET